MINKILNTILVALLVLLSAVLVQRMIMFQETTVIVMDGIVLLACLLIIYKAIVDENTYVNPIYKWLFKLRRASFTINTIRYFPAFKFYIGVEEDRKEFISIIYDDSDWSMFHFYFMFIGFEIEFIDWKEVFRHDYYWKSTTVARDMVPEKWVKIISKERWEKAMQQVEEQFPL